MKMHSIPVIVLTTAPATERDRQREKGGGSCRSDALTVDT